MTLTADLIQWQLAVETVLTELNLGGTGGLALQFYVNVLTVDANFCSG